MNCRRIRQRFQDGQRSLLRLLRVPLLLLLFATSAFGQIQRVDFEARIVRIGVPTSDAAVQHFIRAYGLHAETGPGGFTEIPFTGSYSFDGGQKDQEPQSRRGGYTLREVRINGIAIPLSPYPLTRIDIVEGLPGDQDSFSIVVSRFGELGISEFELKVFLARGTLSEDSLPADSSFLVKGLSFEAPGNSFIYFPPGVPSAFSGTVRWARCGNGSPDTDEDGIFDCWETDGIDSDGDGTVDLVLGKSSKLDGPADPHHKDIFLEIDWMEHHRPAVDTIDRMKRAFAKADITLHIILSDEVPHIERIFFGPPDERTSVDFPDDTKFLVSFFDIKTKVPLVSGKLGFFGNDSDSPAAIIAKRLIFHYVLFAHQMHAPDANGRGEFLGNDLVVAGGALDPFRYGVFGPAPLHVTGTSQQLAGIAVHELGHNLNLFHGGDDDTQCKPNYLSVMNYSRMFENQPIRGLSLAFSPFRMADLNEDALRERTGVTPHPSLPPDQIVTARAWLRSQAVAFGFPTPGFDGQLRPKVATTGGAIDWNGNGRIDAFIPFEDINWLKGPDIFAVVSLCDGKNLNGAGVETGSSILSGFNDLEHMIFDFRLFAAGGYGDSAVAAYSGDDSTPLLYGWSKDDDGDGITTMFDNCPLHANPGQEDADHDGDGDACSERVAGDVNLDRVLDCFDLRDVAAAMGSRPKTLFWDPGADLVRDEVIDLRDLAAAARFLPRGMRCQ